MAMSLRNKGYKSDINITPYIDILLVLMIIFMLATPMKKWDQQVRVPKPAATQQQAVRNESVVIELSLNYDITINTLPVTFADLPKKLTAVFSARADKNMFIRGDPALSYGYVFQILNIAKQSGVRDIALLDKKPAAGALAQTSAGGSEAAGFR